MKKFLLVILALHVLMEGVVGLILMFSPTTMAPDIDASAQPYLIYYGAAGVTMALLVAWYWPHRNNLVAATLALGLLATFHTTLLVGGILVATTGGDRNIMATHGGFALCFWLLWRRRSALVQG